MEIGKIGVVGAGTMGNGIAQALALAGIDVVLTDVAKVQLERATASVAGSRISKLAPHPGALWTRMAPPISRTMSRTIITHGSTQLAVLAMLLFGVWLALLHRTGQPKAEW